MEITSTKNKFENIKAKVYNSQVKNFFYSGYYLTFLACVTVICWNFALVPLGLIFHGLIITFLLIFSDDISVIFPSILGLVFIFPPETDMFKYAYSLVILVPIALSLIFHLRY